MITQNMKRGSKADFWRAIKIGSHLARYGWRPWQIDIDRELSVRVNERIGSGRSHASVDPTGDCHTGTFISFPEVKKTAAKKTRAPLISVIGRGFDLTIENHQMALSRGMDSVSDIEHLQPKGTYSANGGGMTRLRLPPSRRAHLIRAIIRWFRVRGDLGWSASSITFHRSSAFQAEGVRWRLLSDIFFYRREGLYWNNYLTSEQVGARQFKRLQRTGFYANVQRDFEGMGFRVLALHPHGLPFDQDFLPSSELIRKAACLARWRPRKVHPK